MGLRRNRKDGAASLRGQQNAKSYANAAYTCGTHGKRAWVDRKDAKRVCRQMRRGSLGHADAETRLREYRCDITGHWHIGHLPPDVVAGVVSMADAKATMMRRDARRAKEQAKRESAS